MHALLATTLALLLTTTSASPLQKRNVGGIRLCDQVNWAGNCWYGIVPLNECIALNSLYVVHSHNFLPNSEERDALNRCAHRNSTTSEAIELTDGLND